MNRTWDVCSSTDAIWCDAHSKRLAKEMGFLDIDQAKIAIVVRELVSNVIKYAGKGKLTLRQIVTEQHDGSLVGIEIFAEDDGPGIDKMVDAIKDGYSQGRFVEGQDYDPDRQGLGAGLGGICRFMDYISIENKPSGGLRVVVRKYLPKNKL
jgi:serine/threonine-protein kinase RsbT